MRSVLYLLTLDAGYFILWDDGEIEYLTKHELIERVEKISRGI